MHDLHLPQIEDVTAADLGEYQCYVHNGAARDMATLTLTAVPAEARVLRAELTPSPMTYNMTWAVESVAPLRLYALEYRKVCIYMVVTEEVSYTPRGLPPYLISSLTLNS